MCPGSTVVQHPTLNPNVEGSHPSAETSGLYYKHMTIINDDDSSVVNKLGASHTEDARVVIYNRHMFIVQATGERQCKNPFFVLSYRVFH